MYKASLPFNVPAYIMKASWSKVNGVNVKTFTQGDLIYVSAKSYGGTEKIINNQYVIADTLVIETWYRPDIASDDALKLLDDNSEWEIINTPEDIERRHQYLKFKVQRYKGDA